MEKSGRSSSALYTYVRRLPEIPALVIDDHRFYFLRRKRNLLVSSHFDDAALAGDNLIETPAVLELNRDYLIPDTRLPASFQLAETGLRNRIQALRDGPPLKVIRGWRADATAGRL